MNGGTCRDDIGTYNCSCPLGYGGDVCQTGESIFGYWYSIYGKLHEVSLNINVYATCLGNVIKRAFRLL